MRMLTEQTECVMCMTMLCHTIILIILLHAIQRVSYVKSQVFRHAKLWHTNYVCI